MASLLASTSIDNTKNDTLEQINIQAKPVVFKIPTFPDKHKEHNLKQKQNEIKNKCEIDSLNIKDKYILWRPSGGLGHCLHNLSWAINRCKERSAILLIYGLKNHIPFGEYFDVILEMKNKNLKYVEIKNINKLCEKFKISEGDRTLIHNAKYTLGYKNLSSDTKIDIVCSTWRFKVSKYLKLNKVYLDEIIKNPFKYYKNNFILLKSLDKSKNIVEEAFTFHIKGSYFKALGIMNKHLGINKDDKDYYNKPKTLELKYINIYDKTITVKMVELSEHKIKNIKEIKYAKYGLLKKYKDVTDRVNTHLLKKETNPFTTNDIQYQKEEIKNILQK